ncbi:type II toxin-antitoxin system Phd/YefM family antitoxin [Sphingomonas sp. ZT3P38]|uniref:type II toxin-antitoxin system Phd/YefM family antitoxin n=1 Tax=Parasphingomonas zepuensis TaxID=3096161 RepID=UPI002FCCB7D8
MTKYVGAAEFKAKCLKLIDEMQADGESITITKRGKPVAVLSAPKKDEAFISMIGYMESPAFRFDDPFSPAVDLSEVDADNPAAWDDLL